MILRMLLLVGISLAPLAAHAQWDIGGGLENYQWTEYPGGSSIPKENGLRKALFIEWMQDGERGNLLAWRTKVYGGTVNYDTFLISNGAPVSTTTEYSGMSNEGQLFFRDELDSIKLDYLAGLGLDYWQRTILSGGANQVEDYSILFLRAGLRVFKTANETGFHGECGVKYPVSTSENAHLNEVGFTSNPNLSPKGELSGYAELGYRFNAEYDLRAYYDSWRFGRSDNVRATDSTGTPWAVYQPKSNMNTLGIKLLVSFR